MSWSREKQELRRKICQAARQIAQAGYVAANDGNLSARCSDGGVLITPSGVYKGDLEEDMLLEVDLEGRVLSGTGRPSSESPMHLALYRTRPEVGGVVHTHAPYSVFSANLGEDLTEPITADWALLLGPVPALPWLPLGTEELAGAVARAAEGQRRPAGPPRGGDLGTGRGPGMAPDPGPGAVLQAAVSGPAAGTAYPGPGAGGGQGTDGPPSGGRRKEKLI